jgi:hypothetical protein
MLGTDDVPRIVIARVGKRQSLSKQAEKDQVLTAERMRRNHQLLDRVTRRLHLISGQKKELLVVARHLSEAINVPLDRLAKRSRDCLLCWFCENWRAVESLFAGLCPLQPRVEHPRNSCAGILQAAATEIRVPFEEFDDFDFTCFSIPAFKSSLGGEGGFFDFL